MENYGMEYHTSTEERRIGTGIEGLDELLQGGYPKGSVTLVAGTPGTGKTIICFQYLNNGVKNKEKCLFLTSDERIDNLVNQAKKFGFDFDEAVKGGQLKFLYLDLEKHTVHKDMEDEISEYRVVPKNKRAVDTEANADFSAISSPQALKRMLSIYGIETFFRIHLRKCNFELIEKVIESGEVNRKADLKNLKDMIEKVKGNCDKDPNLPAHAESLAHLERSLSRRILMSRA